MADARPLWPSPGQTLEELDEGLSADEIAARWVEREADVARAVEGLVAALASEVPGVGE